ncbi:DUF2182 domain-containing protein [Novosphingobium malaysiense]|uniref:Metal-binding protein n=1 Tax=Novosphingobium malaysiense TaxID=1348853 RepID=A0A0B1ZJG9_9SPHN|nr:DUF2182 domain-containing protein [Novosphingobium malaysiense]KHK89482.1 metal-binding protein [Novosphingobium malaysiense]
MDAVVEELLARHRAVSVVSLFVLTLSAWAWLATGAGMDMRPGFFLPPLLPQDGARLTGMQGMDMGSAGILSGAVTAKLWSVWRFLLTFWMWWVMMVAMMLPSAARMILLYVRAASSRGTTAIPSTGSFLAGYLLVWGLFSLVATGLQMLLELAGLLAGMDMMSVSRPLSAAVLIAAGIYQLSPLKDVCLHQCRSPARFLSRSYRAGKGGALAMGARHGAFCIGCCWLLMALLFVGGVMNIAWIAILTLIVAAEKMLPGGRGIAFAGGIVCLVWALWILVA